MNAIDWVRILFKSAQSKLQPSRRVRRAALKVLSRYSETGVGVVGRVHYPRLIQMDRSHNHNVDSLGKGAAPIYQRPSSAFPTPVSRN